jgi:hypothetical protein
MKSPSVVSCKILFCLSLSRIAKRVVKLFELPPREILSMLHHPFSHDLHLSTRVHTIHSIQSRVHTIHCTRMRAGVELCHSPPRRFSQPVVHNQESPLVSYASYVCVRVAGLYSTRGILKLDSRSQGKRRRTEEKAHSHQNRVSYSITRWVYIQSLADCHGWMWVFSGSDFSRVSLKRLLSVTLRCLRR